MVRGKTKASIGGMVAGVLVVTGAGLASGIDLFSSLTLSIVGLAIGGWLAERYYDGRAATDERDGTETV